MRVTIKEIARELGISHSTVSRVLNEKQSALVSDATRDRIMQAATRMGYRPNRLAQALKGNTTGLIGVFLPDGKDFFFQEVMTHLHSLVQGAGFDLIPFPSSTQEVSKNWTRLLHWDLDGVFVFDYLFYAEGLWDALMVHRGYIPPMVGLCSYQPRLQDYVALDFEKAMIQLLDHFLAQGCRRIGYMGRPVNYLQEEQRYAVFTKYLAQFGLTALNVPIDDSTNLCASSRQTMLEYVQAGNDVPDALFCQNDEIALGAYRALYELGISVPGNVALCGCDNIPYVAYLESPLTTLALPVEALCCEGWKILQYRMANPGGAPLQVTLEASLVVRESSQTIYDQAIVHG